MRRRFAEIDVLRGLAAVWVMLSHYLPHWNQYLGHAPIIVPNSFGVYAVELFFVISGFVIFMTLERARSVADFAILRASRLYPAYWTAIAVGTSVGVFEFGETFWRSGVVTNATMFQEFLGFPHLDNVFWSLSVELAFYLNAAWLFAFGLHRRVRAVVLVWLALGCVWAIAVHDPGASHRDWYARLFALDYAPFFAMGIVFFEAVQRGWSASKVYLLAAAIATEFTISGWSGVTVAIVVAALFWLAVEGHLRFLVSRLTLWLGAISYSLYLVHRNMGYEALEWLHARHVTVGVAVPVTIAGALALATLLTYVVERPVLEKIRGWRERRDRRRISAPVPVGA